MTNEDLQDLAEFVGVDALFVHRIGVVFAIYNENTTGEDQLQELVDALPQPIQLISVARRGRSIKRIWDEQFPEAAMVA